MWENKNFIQPNLEQTILEDRRENSITTNLSPGLQRSCLLEVGMCSLTINERLVQQKKKEEKIEEQAGRVCIWIILNFSENS